MIGAMCLADAILVQEGQMRESAGMTPEEARARKEFEAKKTHLATKYRQEYLTKERVEERAAEKLRAEHEHEQKETSRLAELKRKENDWKELEGEAQRRLAQNRLEVTRRAEEEKAKREQREATAAGKRENTLMDELSGKADRARREAENSEFVDSPDVEGLFGGVLVAELRELSRELSSESHLEAKIEEPLSAMERTTAQFLLKQKGLTDKFIQEANFTVTDKSLVKLVEKFLKDSMEMLAAHQVEDSAHREKLAEVLPDPKFHKLVMALAPRAVPLNFTSMEGYTKADGCAAVTHQIAQITPHYKHLGKLSLALHAASDVARDSKTSVHRLSRRLINFGYFETTSFQNAAVELISKVAPVVLSRLQCTFSASGQRVGLGFVALLAVVVGWVFH